MMNRFLRGAVYASALLTFGALGFIILFVLYQGIPHLEWSLFSKTYTAANASVFPSLVTTFYLTLGSLLVAGPIGIFTAIYLVEYANRKKWYVKVIGMAIDTLAAVPSIVYGLFGFLMFVTALKFGFSVLAGTLTMVIMVLPLIIRSAEEALLTVDPALREASYALGAGKLMTIFSVVLPVALPGILSGILLAIGRIIGESAALIYTLGSATILPKGFFQSGRTLAVHIYMLVQEGHHVGQAYAAAAVLIVVVLIINGLSTWVTQRLSSER